MYTLLTGPLLELAIVIFVVGLTYKVVRYVKGLDWKLERIAYEEERTRGLKGAVASIIQWLIPFGTHSWRRQPYFTLAFFLFHAGLVLVPLFFIGHNVILQERLGFSFPSLPLWLSDGLTVGALLGGLMMILRRISLPEVRFITNKTDWFVLCLSIFVLLSGFLARLGAPGYETWLLWHIFSAEVVLVCAPFTKLSHIVLYFMSRGQLGMDFAIKRGGASRGPAYPW